MKCVLSVFFAMLILISSASASSVKGLEQAFGELEYSLTVEWDQKDEAFKEVALAKFHSNILELKSEGVSEVEMFTFSLTKIKDPELKISLERSYQDFQKGIITNTEFESHVSELIAHSRLQGASWSDNADAVWLLAKFLAVAFVIGMLLDNGFQNTSCIVGTPDCD